MKIGPESAPLRKLEHLSPPQGGLGLSVALLRVGAMKLLVNRLWQHLPIRALATLSGSIAAMFAIEYAMGKLPWDSLPLSQFWVILIYRSTYVCLALILIYLLTPNYSHYLGFRIRQGTLLFSLLTIAVMTLPQIINSPISRVSLFHVFGAFVFALFIGINEEIFFRGFVYSLLSKVNQVFAISCSSLFFGLSHLSNLFYGGQSFAYTSSQIMSAAFFGYLCTCLMLYSGSIWMPILLHGLNDFSWQFYSQKENIHIVTGGFDWAGTITSALMCFIIGFLLLSYISEPRRIMVNRMLFKLGLVE
jgi:membrane protease YdiL (CAAX protease family)